MSSRYFLKMIHESTLLEGYRPPSDGSQRMFDFYALERLSSLYNDQPKSIIRGMPVNPVAAQRITHHKRAMRVKYTFEECLATLSRDVLQATRAAIWDEMENVIDEYLIPPNELFNYLESNPTLKKLFDFTDWQSKGFSFAPGAERVISFPEAIKLWDAPFWAEYADQYGGDRWKAITEQANHLLVAFKSGNVRALAFELDRVYDLDHNTGSLSEKWPKDLAVAKADLDKRASIRSIHDFIGHVSSQVENMIKADPNL